MYRKEKEYCLIGVIVTIPALLFGVAGVFAVWMFVGLFCLSYHYTLDQNFHKHGMKIFGADPLSNPDTHVYLRFRLRNPDFRDAFFNGLTEEAKDRFPWLREFEPKKDKFNTFDFICSFITDRINTGIVMCHSISHMFT